VVGRYVLSGAIFDHLENLGAGAGGEIQLTDGIAALMRAERVLAYRYAGQRYDCGSKLGYLKATAAMGLKHPETAEGFREFLAQLAKEEKGMAVREILKMGDPRLLRVAEPVREFDTPELHALVADMFETMHAVNGAGLAAPQIGVNLQLVIFGFGQNQRYPDAPQRAGDGADQPGADAAVRRDGRGLRRLPVGAGPARQRAALHAPALRRRRPVRQADQPRRRRLPCARGAARGRPPAGHPVPDADQGLFPLRLYRSDVPRSRSEGRRLKRQAAPWRLVGIAHAGARGRRPVHEDRRRPKSELWIDSGFATYHFNRDKDLNGGNAASGRIPLLGTLAATAGRFYNSDREYSNYAGVIWQPYALGPVRLGAAIAASTAIRTCATAAGSRPWSRRSPTSSAWASMSA
jgi:hypothetical protein